ncbi:MAG: hypothetical protein R2867_15380 [Caldilineaceae bacterium]
MIDTNLRSLTMMLPTRCADQAVVSEGDSGSTTISFTITRTGAITTTTGTVDFEFGGTATNGSDYNHILPASQQVIFGDLAVTATVTVDVLGDLTDEDDELITASLITPTIFPAGGTATISDTSQSTTILDDDTAAIVITGDTGTPLAEGHCPRLDGNASKHSNRHSDSDDHTGWAA